jgi:DNA-binding XRE family transcriptional regulator
VSRRVKSRQGTTKRRVVLAEGRKAKLAQRERWDRAVVAVWQATRRDSDLSQDALAQKLGWSRDTVGSVEAGRRKVTVTDVVLFAAALGIEPETIFRRILRW